MEVITLSASENRQLKDAFLEIDHVLAGVPFHRKSFVYLRALAIIAQDAWIAIQHHWMAPGAKGVLHIQNLPLDNRLPETPNSGHITEKVGCGDALANASLTCISAALGAITAYQGEGDGSFIHDIFPRKSYEETQSNQGSLQELRFHNDITYDSTAFYRSNPDYLVLFCLRNPQATKTCYLESREIVQAIDGATVAMLREPRFHFSAPYNYSKKIGRSVTSSPMPIMVGPVENPEIRYTASGVFPVDSQAAMALERLNEALPNIANRYAVALQPADALIINNRKGLHYRENFLPAYDGNDRWLKRCYVRRELWSMRHLLTESTGVFLQK